LSSSAVRRSSLGASSLDGEALDTLFSASGADASLAVGEPADDGLAGLTAVRPAVRQTEPADADASATPVQGVRRNGRDSARSADASSPSRRASGNWAVGTADSMSVAPAVASEGVVGEDNPLVEAADAVVEKSAEAAARAYESLVDAVF